MAANPVTIAEREQQILRVSQQGLHPKLNETLATELRIEVIATVKTVIESALNEEIKAFLNKMEDKKKPYRSGFYYRGLNT